MSADFSKIEQSKRKMRARLAALPFAEKLRVLDQLRELTLALRTNSLRTRTSVPLIVDVPEHEQKQTHNE